MTFTNILRIAIAALGKNKLRAGLTILGVVIGIAAVTAMVSIGTSASELVQGEFKTSVPTSSSFPQGADKHAGLGPDRPLR